MIGDIVGVIFLCCVAGMLFGPAAWSLGSDLRDAYKDVASDDEGRWATLAERDRWSR